MRTAVIISGQTRTFARCLPSMHWQVFRHLENPTFFCSVAKDEDAESIELLRKKYPNAPVFIETVEQPTLAEPPLHYAAFAPYAITPTKTAGIGPLQGILRQLWHLSRAYKFAVEITNAATHDHRVRVARGETMREENALTAGINSFDLFVRCRPDLHFHRFRRDRGILRSDEALTPWWGAFGPGVNDRFAMLGPIAAKAYFETYDALPTLLEMGCPFHPETLVGANLDRLNCTIDRTLAAEFAFMRKTGELVHMSILHQELAAYTAHLSKQ